MLKVGNGDFTHRLQVEICYYRETLKQKEEINGKR